MATVISTPSRYTCHKISSVMGNGIENPITLPNIQNDD